MRDRVPWFQLENAEAWIGNRRIFDNLSLTLFREENTAILGPNGAGKSAIVKLIDRTIYPVVKNTSNIKFFGKENMNLWRLRSRMGFVSTELNTRFPKDMSSLDIMISGCYRDNSIKSIGLSKDYQKNNLEKLIKQFSIENISNRIFDELSDGEKRKILIARSLINNPDILVLDEPISGLDLKSKFNLIASLEEISAKETTVIQVTHNIQTILRSIKRVVLLKNGQIISDGRKSECLTSEKLSELFEINLKVFNHNGYWHVFPKP